MCKQPRAYAAILSVRSQTFRGYAQAKLLNGVMVSGRRCSLKFLILNLQSTFWNVERLTKLFHFEKGCPALSLLGAFGCHSPLDRGSKLRGGASRGAGQGAGFRLGSQVP